MKTNNLPTIQSLRRKGYKVRVTHKRTVTHYVSVHGSGPTVEVVTKEAKAKRLYQRIHEKGGGTHVDITTPDGRPFSVEARCSRKDSFNRKLGISICLGRLALVGAFDSFTP